MRAFVLLFSLLSLLVILVVAFNQVPSFTSPLPSVAQYYVENTYTRIGIINVISAVTFDWRGFDTLGEATLLLTAATGIRLIMRRWLQRRRQTGRV